MQPGILGLAGRLVRMGLAFCFQDGQTMAQNSLTLKPLQMAIVIGAGSFPTWPGCWVLHSIVDNYLTVS